MDLSPIRFEYHLRCAPGPAFDAYVQQIGRWWHPSYSPDPDGFVGATIEPWVGGRVLLEDATRGALPWGEVLEVDAATRLVHSSTLGQTREHPSRITVTFAPVEGGTLMTFEHGGWTEENATDRTKFTEWPLLLDRYAAVADGA
jgi:hypothetical protein